MSFKLYLPSLDMHFVQLPEVRHNSCSGCILRRGVRGGDSSHCERAQSAMGLRDDGLHTCHGRIFIEDAPQALATYWLEKE